MILRDRDVAVEVDVIEVDEREEARIRPPALQMAVEVDALQAVLERGRDDPAPRPLVEIAEHDLRRGDAAIVHPSPRGAAPGNGVRGARCPGARCRPAAGRARRCPPRRAGRSAVRRSSTSGHDCCVRGSDAG